MKDIDRRLSAIAERQHGVVSREQARSAGLTASGLSYRIKQGHLVVCGTSTFHLPGSVLTWYGRLTAGLLDLVRVH